MESITEGLKQKQIFSHLMKGGNSGSATKGFGQPIQRTFDKKKKKSFVGPLPSMHKARNIKTRSTYGNELVL